MRHLILSSLTAYLFPLLLCSCHSQKQVESDFSEDVRLTNTTATTSSSQSLLDVVLSWSCDFDSLDIFVENPIDSCRSSAAVAAAQPSRLHLRARHASIANKSSIRQSIQKDSASVDSVEFHHTTRREDKSNSESSGVYKPPDGRSALITIIIVIILIFFIRLLRL